MHLDGIRSGGGDYIVNAVSLRAALVALIVVAVAGCGVTLGGAPILAAPTNGHTFACAAPGQAYLFTWGAVPNAINYVLHIEANAAPNPLVYNATIGASTTTLAVTDAQLPYCGDTFRWRVGATFATSPTAWSGYWTFTILTGGPTPPPAGMEPILVVPPNNASIAAATPLFNWQPPAGGTPLEYKVLVRNSGGVLIWYFGTPSTSATYAGPALVNGQTYSWFVIAVHAPPNPPASSEVWTFTKVAP